jgi:hypothetical protein
MIIIIMTADATLEEQRRFSLFFFMRIMTGIAGKRLTHPETFAGPQQAILVAMKIYSRRIGSRGIKCKIIGQLIARNKFKRRFCFLQSSPMAQGAGIQLQLP